MWPTHTHTNTDVYANVHAIHTWLCMYMQVNIAFKQVDILPSLKTGAYLKAFNDPLGYQGYVYHYYQFGM